MDQTFEKRKKIIYALICDDYYIPMKLKEIAALLQVPKDQRQELKDVVRAMPFEKTAITNFAGDDGENVVSEQ